MGCYMETAKATVDYLRDEKGIAAGCLTVFVFRPFPARQIVEALKDCQAFTVFERMDDPLSTTGNHLTREIKAAFCDAITGQNGQERIDAGPADLQRAPPAWAAATSGPATSSPRSENMIDDGPDFFCVGIDHPLALKRTEDPDLRPHGGFSMRGHSVGGFGSVTTNKVIATIAGDVFGKDVQAYPKYGSEKKGLPTTYYLTIADSHINMHCELEHVDLVVHQRPDRDPQRASRSRAWCPAARSSCSRPTPTRPRSGSASPTSTGGSIREKKLRVYYADMVKIAREVASRGRPADAHAGHRPARRVPEADAVRAGRAR